MDRRGEGGRSKGLPLEKIGTTVSDLVAGCDKPAAKHASPPLPETLPAFAVALSGGGFRATLAGIGVLRFLADAGLLGRVRHVSSVSGGSIGNALFARAYPQLKASGFSMEGFVQHVEKPAVDHISGSSLTVKLARNVWRAIGPGNRTTLLAWALDDWFFGQLELSELAPDCRFVFNAANLTTGVRFSFERDVIGDWVVGTVKTTDWPHRLSIAAACSAGVPGFFTPYQPKATFPCQERGAPKLVDGGVYENTGTEPLDRLKPEEHCLVVLNAGGVFRTGGFGSLPLIRDLMRSEGLLYRQSTALRMRSLVERFQQWEKRGDQPAPATALRGVLFGLSTSLAASPEWLEGRPEQSPELKDHLARLKTSFAKFTPEDCRQLIYRGWWLTGATLSLYHRDLLPASLPTWNQPV
jgi:NTE family protein